MKILNTSKKESNEEPSVKEIEEANYDGLDDWSDDDSWSTPKGATKPPASCAHFVDIDEKPPDFHEVDFDAREEEENAKMSWRKNHDKRPAQGRWNRRY